jgi:hypothetical protein
MSAEGRKRRWAPMSAFGQKRTLTQLALATRRREAQNHIVKLAA